MARVICILPNASESISGVTFAPCRGGMLSDEIDDGVAERFARIPGYRLVEDTQQDAEQPAKRRGRPRKEAQEGDA